MSAEWHELTSLTNGRPIVVERVRLTGTDIRIEGEFDPPPLARLRANDQVFVAAFVQAHGSIKKMEKVFGVSYPTIKNRLNRISEQLELVEIDVGPAPDDVLERLERGELTAREALEMLKQ